MIQLVQSRLCKNHIMQILFLIISIAPFVISQQQAPVESKTRTKILIPDLPLKHYQYWLKSQPRAFNEFKNICSSIGNSSEVRDSPSFRLLHNNLTFENPKYLSNFDYSRAVLDAVCSKINIISKSCWGYESNCQYIHLMPECYGSSLGQAKSKQEQKISWFSQADFGYILDRRKELTRYCIADKYSNNSVKSSLECTRYFKTCRGDDLMIQFEGIPKEGSLIRDNQMIDVSKSVGGWNCDLQLKRIQEESGQQGALQSWFKELRSYNHIKAFQPEEGCDIKIEKQAYVLKLDSTTNMYHYFCNFLNLYATMHLHNRMSQDNQIIIWDNRLPKSRFEEMWRVFSKNPLSNIREFEGKRVCFKKVIFTLPPRMIDGLYYNTPLIPGCSKTGLFDAFNKHVLHKLNVIQRYNKEMYEQNGNEEIRITVVSRTKFRKVINEDELVASIKNVSSHFYVKKVTFEEGASNFYKQLDVVQNTDILIGMHGAGLTNTLFLPDWAALVELYNCKDKCYHDLARLRGSSYFTSNDKQALTHKVTIEDDDERNDLKSKGLLNHDKFSNYRVELSEFLKILDKAVTRVKENRSKFFKQEDALVDEEVEKELEVDIKKKQSTDTSSMKHIEL